MAVSEQQRLRRPAATLTLRRLPPDVVVLVEADIPAEFFVPQPPPPPKLDKAALKEALKARTKSAETAATLTDPLERAAALASAPSIPGATLNNGGGLSGETADGDHRRHRWAARDGAALWQLPTGERADDLRLQQGETWTAQPARARPAR